MTVAEHAYAYLAPSALGDDGALNLATSGGRSRNPHFFTGALARPRQAAQALLVVSEIARTRFFTPPNMVVAAILAADPVVTSNVDRLRFESFSACRGVYARLDLEPGALAGAFSEWGTTNVDFNPPMRAALAGVRDADGMLVNVGHDEVSVTTLQGSALEKKVPLPDSWLKGFAEVQLASARMLAYHELSGVEARRFLQSLPRGKGRGAAWATPAGQGLRIASRPDPRAVCVASPERLRLLERLLPFARSLRVYGPPASGARSAEASAWELTLEDARVTFVVSPELFRGFSGEGNVLGDLAGADDASVGAVAQSLHGEPAIEPEAVAKVTGLAVGAVQSALAVLGAAGRVGFDLGRSAYFHRELPFDRAVLEGMHPRLLGALQLVGEGAVALDTDGRSATVRSGDVAYLVRLGDAGPTCTCPWFAKHRGARGPCKHVLAFEQVLSARATHA
ncbi:MAG: SWIM zinc finger family protein [Actinobacteria bacterium]|nr:SWIM zinc finger family protein [Actinomycetota bacterium]